MDDAAEENPMVAKTEGQDLLMERGFAAPRDLVYQMFSDQEHLTNWWGPEGWQTEIRRFEFRPNGVWHYCMRCTDERQGDFFGQESWGMAVYHELSRPERIVYTDMFVDEEGHLLAGMPKILVTMEFHDEGNNHTRVTIRSRFASEEALRQVLEMGAVEGFESQFERLAGYLDRIQEELLDYQ
ncbi:SRPBCC domain-containing protein [Sporolactobacillus vineae]|uniref:SRPBCC domain-containing protein n=1 Tax=Sporolactobacillus vineae TaxID=444463 RepID=UPI0002891A19|nr:SRPBCC domain-containing protein [Sporolactobacillus vineae]